MHWLKLHHNAVRDLRLRVAGVASSEGTAVAVAVWAFLLDAASQAEDRGSVADVRPNTIDVALDLRAGTARRVITALRDEGILTGELRFSDWEERQANPFRPAPMDAEETATAAPSPSRQEKRRPMTNAEKCRAYRERKRLAAARGSTTADTADDTMRHHATPCDTMRHQIDTNATPCDTNATPCDTAHPLRIRRENLESRDSYTARTHARIERSGIDVADITLAQIWDAYPAEFVGSLPDAEREWHFVKRDARTLAKGVMDILDGLARWKESDGWKRNYVPSLAGFLRRRMWLVTPPPPPVISEAARRSEAWRVFDGAVKAGAMEPTPEELAAYDERIRLQAERDRKELCNA